MTTPAAPGAPEGGQQTSGGQPAPGAQANAPHQQGQQPTPGASAQQPTDAQDVAALPEWAQKLIKDARADAGRARTTAKQQAADDARQQLMAEIGKTLGLSPDGQPTLEDLQRQLTERDKQIGEFEEFKLETAYREAVRGAAPSVGADADALLDSDSFRTAVGDELGEDFGDADLAKAVAKVAKEFAKRPRFARQQGAARSGADFTGGPAAPQNIDQQIADAESKGDHRTAIFLKRRRASLGQ